MLEIFHAHQVLHYVPEPWEAPWGPVTVWRPHITWVGLLRGGRAVILSGNPLSSLYIEMGFAGWAAVGQWMEAYMAQKSPPDPAFSDLRGAGSYRLITWHRGLNNLPDLSNEEEIVRRLSLAWIAHEARRCGVWAKIILDYLVIEDDRAVPFPIRPLQLQKVFLYTSEENIQNAPSSLVCLPHHRFRTLPYRAFSVNEILDGNGIVVQIGKELEGVLLDHQWGGQLDAAHNWELEEARPSSTTTADLFLIASTLIRLTVFDEVPGHFGISPDGNILFADAETEKILSPYASARSICEGLAGRAFIELKKGKKNITVSKLYFYPTALDLFIQGRIQAQRAVEVLQDHHEILRRVALAQAANRAVAQGQDVELTELGVRMAVPLIGELGRPIHAVRNVHAPVPSPVIAADGSGAIRLPQVSHPPQPWAIRVGRWAAAMLDEGNAIIAAPEAHAAMIAGLCMQDFGGEQ